MKNKKPKATFTLQELTDMKNILVKAQKFELASKCREIERQHPDYKPSTTAPTFDKNKWEILVDFVPEFIDKYGKEEFLKHFNIIIKAPPKGKRVVVKKNQIKKKK